MSSLSEFNVTRFWHWPYIVDHYGSDLHCMWLLWLMNVLFKYANDTNLLVPVNTDVELAVEFSHIQDRAVKNKMQ